MNKEIDMICQHSLNGDIIPMKIRLVDEDKELHIYQVKSYKVIEKPRTVGITDGVKSSVVSWSFECKICVFNCLKSVRIQYNIQNGRWVLIA